MAENGEEGNISQSPTFLNNPNFQRSEQFQKWNGGDWEKVNNDTGNPAYEAAANIPEDGLSSKVMELIGVPKSYTQNLYTDFIYDVNQITTIPSDTASTFYSLISWICGRSSETPSTSTEEKTETVTEKEGETPTEPVQKSSEDALTQSTSQILTPFSVGVLDEDKAKMIKNACERLPSLTMFKPTPTESTLYSNALGSWDDKDPQENTNQASSITAEKSDENEASEVDKKRKFAPMPSETNIYGIQQDTESEKEEEKPPLSPPSPPVLEDVNNEEEAEFIPLPTDRKASKANLEYGKLSLSDLIKANLEGKDGIKLNKKEAPRMASATTLLPTMTPSKIDSKEEEVERTTSEMQLQLKEHLQSLQSIVKQIYKNMDRKGPLTIVANFTPKEDGELECDIGTTEDSALPHIAVASKTNILSSKRSEATTGRLNPVQENSAVEEEFIGKTRSTTQMEAERKKTVQIHEEGQDNSKIFSPWYPNQIKSISKIVAQHDFSQGLMKKPSVSFFTKNVAVRPTTPPIKPGNSFDHLNNNNNSKNAINIPLPPPILKRSSTTGLAHAMEKAWTSSSNITLTDYGTSSQGEDHQRPSTTTNASSSYISSSDRSELQTAPPGPTTPSKSSFAFKTPACKNPKLHQPSLASMTQHQYHHRQGNPNWHNMPPYMNNHHYGNMRVIKSCGAHDNSKSPSYNNNNPPRQYEQGDYVEDTASSDADASTEYTESETDTAKTGSEDTGTEVEVEKKSRKKKTPEIDLPSPPGTATSMKGGQQPKFKASVYIPQTSKRSSYSEMFREKKNQQRTYYVDMTSSKSSMGKSKKTDQQTQVVGQRNRKHHK